jgi:Domain of unknown function (DUF6504)
MTDADLPGRIDRVEDADAEPSGAGPTAPRLSRAHTLEVRVRVECYAGARADESPRRFTWDGRCIEVAEVSQRWRQAESLPSSPPADCFEVRGADGLAYRLEHRPDSDEWFLLRPTPERIIPA